MEWVIWVEEDDRKNPALMEWIWTGVLVTPWSCFGYFGLFWGVLITRSG